MNVMQWFVGGGSVGTTTKSGNLMNARRVRTYRKRGSEDEEHLNAK